MNISPLPLPSPTSSHDFLQLNGVLVFHTVRERERGEVQVWGWGVGGGGGYMDVVCEYRCTYSSAVRVALYPPLSRRPLSSSEGEEGRSCLNGN